MMILTSLNFFMFPKILKLLDTGGIVNQLVDNWSLDDQSDEYEINLQTEHNETLLHQIANTF